MENTVMLTRPAPPASSPAEAMPSGIVPGMTGRTKPTTHEAPTAVQDPPRAARRVYPRRRFGVPVVHTLLAAAGTAAGVYLAVCAPAGTDFSESLLCCSGDFLRLMTVRLLWGLAFLAAEYVLGYFALGGALVWLLPLICGLGTGAALTGAFAVQGAAALKLLPTCISAAAAVVLAARTSGDMSAQLLRLVSSGRNGMAAVVSETPAAGEYTLRFLIYFAVAAGSAVVEAAVRAFS